MSGVTSPTNATVQPTVSVSNITASPVTTILGVTSLINGLVASLPGGNLPTTTAGWVGAGTSLLLGLLGLFSR